jgi:hypothetical protein
VINERPRPAVLATGGWSWRSATPDDAPALEKLASLHSNRALFSLPGSESEFAQRLGQPGFRIPMISEYEKDPVGCAAVASRSHQNLNLRLICFFEHPEEAAGALAVYVRHVFWLVPLHRIYAQIPLLRDADAYLDLFAAVGFVAEGVVRQQGWVGGSAVDVAVFGILRREFDAWCRQREPDLAL